MTIWLSIAALVVVYAVMIPMKLTGQLAPHFTWPKLLIGPPLMLSILPMLVLWGLRRSAAR